ncbi:hypothetical protein TNIN_164281 [Trichonephila inaurata madagascariensis]|uniref:Uncharacterized protein n=1 Tax=Trichonephila inaurata madagascariensis TaxID=2747483 RepID=A0A8X6XU13_9ARAC|nr:hypothetical protein TNIN_164281 [Trichonephila inaurata madagascariensis]
MPDRLKIHAVSREEKRYNSRRYPKELFNKMLWQLLFLFRMSGVYCEERVKSRNRRRFRHFVWKSMEYVYIIITILHFVMKLSSVIFYMIVKEEITMILHVFLLDVLRICLLKKKEAVFEMTKEVSRISEHYIDLKAIKWIRCFNLFFLVVLLLCAITFVLEYHDDEMYVNWSKFLLKLNTKSNSQELVGILNICLKVLVISFNYNSHILLVLATVLFADACYVLEKIFKLVYSSLKTSVTESENCSAIQSYLAVLQVVEYVENSLSLIIFVVALCAMIGLFRGLVIVSFSKNLTPSLCTFLFCYIAGHLAVLFAVVLIASNVNQAAFNARSQVISLQEHAPFTKKRDLKWRQLNIKRKVHLTLWNTYVIDRSLIWSAFATLLTYGILIGTLGIVSERIN